MASWSGSAWLTSDHELPELLDNQIRRVQEVLQQIRSDLIRFNELVDVASLEHVIGSSPVTLPIVGERGSGKSTLLNLVCAKARANGKDLVLPVIRPELFAEGETVISAALASLAVEVERFNNREDGPEEAAKLLRRLQDSSYTYALSRTTRGAIESRQSGPYGFAEDYTLIARSNSTLTRTIYDAVHAITSTGTHGRSGADPSLIIVPIDDADLMPNFLPSILADLRLLGSIPGVVPIPCFSFSDLQAEWIAARRQRNESLDVGYLTRSFAREIEKLFPARTRVGLSDLPMSARVQYVPLGATAETLARLFQRFDNKLGTELSWPINLTSIFTRSHYFPGIESPLPPTPRSLEQMWDALAAATAVGSVERVDRLDALQQVMDIVGSAIPGNLGERALLIDGRAPEVQFSTQLIGDFSLVISRDGPWGVRPLHGRSAEIKQFQRIFVDSRQHGDRVRLTPREAAAALCLQEVSLAGDPVPSDLGAINESDYQFLQRTTIDGSIAPDVLYMLPTSESLTGVCDAAVLWNSIAAESPLDPLAAGAAVINASIAWSDRTTSFNMDPSGGAGTAYNRALEAAVAEYGRCLRNTSDDRARSFLIWFESLLPLQWTGQIVGDDTIQAALHLHGKALRDKVLLREEARNPAERFDKVLAMALGDADHPVSWLEGYELTLRYMGSRYQTRHDRSGDAENFGGVAFHSDIGWEAEQHRDDSLFRRAMEALASAERE